MPVLIAVLVALLWVFALRRWYRQAPSPLESVEHQQRALDALQHAASRARTGPSSPDGVMRPAPIPIHGSRTQRSLTPLVVAAAGTLLLIGVGAIWWVGRSSTNNQSAISATSPTTRARGSVSSTTTTTGPITTTTTLPPTAHATITNQSSSSVAFAVDRPTFTVTITASGPCWMQVTAPAASTSGSGSASTSTSPTSSSSSSGSSTTVLQKTLHAGDTQAIPASGALGLQLGAANNVTIALDGQPLALPSQTQSVLRLTFNGSTNGA